MEIPGQVGATPPQVDPAKLDLPDKPEAETYTLKLTLEELMFLSCTINLVGSQAGLRQPLSESNKVLFTVAADHYSSSFLSLMVKLAILNAEPR